MTAPPAPLTLRPSLRAAASQVAKLAVFLLFVVTVPVLVAVLSGNGLGFLAAILLAETGLLSIVPVVVGLAVPAVRLWATTYELDADGVRVHSSILARSDQRVPWDKVTLLVEDRGLVDRALGISSVTVVAYGARGATLHLVGLRDPRPVRDYAAQRMRASASVASLVGND